MQNLLATSALLGAISSSLGQGIVDFENFNNSLVYTNSVHNGPATGLISGGAGAYYFGLFDAFTNTTTVAHLDDGTPLDASGWLLTGPLGTNTMTPGVLNGNYTTDFDEGEHGNFVVAGWSANIGTTWGAAQAWWNNGNPNAGPSGYFAISSIAQDVVVGGSGF